MNEFIQRLITGLILALVLAYAIVVAPAWGFIALMAAAALSICIFEWPQLCYSARCWLTLPIYPLASFGLLCLMQWQNYRTLVLITFLFSAAFDSGSYLIGKLFGRHKIIPSISPGKSWEGVFGGYITTFIVSLFFFKLGSTPLVYHALFILGCCATALCGDLYESYLKRKAGIKDSASYLPGHGGLLDRLDSVLFVVFYIYAFKDYILTALNN